MPGYPDRNAHLSSANDEFVVVRDAIKTNENILSKTFAIIHHLQFLAAHRTPMCRSKYPTVSLPGLRQVFAVGGLEGLTGHGGFLSLGKLFG
jgi:hypothetical protein